MNPGARRQRELGAVRGDFSVEVFDAHPSFLFRVTPLLNAFAATETGDIPMLAPERIFGVAVTEEDGTKFRHLAILQLVAVIPATIQIFVPGRPGPGGSVYCLAQ